MSIPGKAAVFRSMAIARRSCRRFQRDREIPSDTLREILETSLRSPSSFNLQPWQMVVVRDSAKKEELAEQAMLGPGNQFRTNDCSALVVILSDLEPSRRIQRVYDLEKPYKNPNYLGSLPLVPSFLIGEGHLATFLKQVSTSFLSNVQAMPSIESVDAWSYKNTALLAQSLVYAAESHDLASCIMEGYDARKVKDLLRIPDRYAIPMTVALGYDFEERSEAIDTPRLPVEEVVFEESFGNCWSDEQ